MEFVEPAALEAARALAAAGVPDEALATLKQGRFTAAKFIPVGRAWRLGVLLVDAAGELYETGEVTRAVEPLRGVANKSPDAEQRRELRRAATRGKFAVGQAVNFGFVPIAHGTKVFTEGGETFIRWSQTGAPMPIAQYLAERVDLLVNGA